MIHEQDRMLALMKELLGENFMHLEVVGYDLHEDFTRSETLIACKIKDNRTQDVTTIEGRGVGMIDAFFHGLLDRLSKEYPSLQTIAIDKFSVDGNMGSGREQNRADAMAQVTIGIKNSSGGHFEFNHESRSVTRSGIEATLRAAEYFVNSERAFVATFKALKSSRAQNRNDLVARYTDLMSRLVRNTSYSEVIENIRKEVGS